MELDQRIRRLVRSWKKYHNPKELEKDVKGLLDSVVARVRNKFEFELHDQLKQSGRHFGYESVKFPYILTGWYLPDWVIYTDSTRTKVDFAIEAKGYFRPESKRKLVSVKKEHPWLDLRLVFYAHRKKDVRWAEKHGFKYAIKTIPEEWLNGKVLVKVKQRRRPTKRSVRKSRLHR